MEFNTATYIQWLLQGHCVTICPTFVEVFSTIFANERVGAISHCDKYIIKLRNKQSRHMDFLKHKCLSISKKIQYHILASFVDICFVIAYIPTTITWMPIMSPALVKLNMTDLFPCVERKGIFLAKTLERITDRTYEKSTIYYIVGDWFTRTLF